MSKSAEVLLKIIEGLRSVPISRWIAPFLRAIIYPVLWGVLATLVLPTANIWWWATIVSSLCATFAAVITGIETSIGKKPTQNLSTAQLICGWLLPPLWILIGYLSYSPISPTKPSTLPPTHPSTISEDEQLNLPLPLRSSMEHYLYSEPTGNFGWERTKTEGTFVHDRLATPLQSIMCIRYMDVTEYEVVGGCYKYGYVPQYRGQHGGEWHWLQNQERDTYFRVKPTIFQLRSTKQPEDKECRYLQLHCQAKRTRDQGLVVGTKRAILASRLSQPTPVGWGRIPALNGRALKAEATIIFMDKDGNEYKPLELFVPDKKPRIWFSKTDSSQELEGTTPDQFCDGPVQIVRPSDTDSPDSKPVRLWIEVPPAFGDTVCYVSWLVPVSN